MLIPVVIFSWSEILFYVAVACILCMMLPLLFLPGNQSAGHGSTKGVPKIVTIWAGILAAPIILGGGLVTLFIFFFVFSTCFLGAGGCSDSGINGALKAETETVQAAMDVMMVENKLVTVSANDDNTGNLGVNTWTGLPEGPGASSLDGYLHSVNTLFYYCWDSEGNVYAQNKKDGEKAEPDDAENQRPCKKSPTDPR